MKASSRPVFRLCHLYPREMDTYADRGNIAVLNWRLKWRDMQLEVVESGLGEKLDSSLIASTDLIYLGGGQDQDQEVVSNDLLKTKAESVSEICASGRVGLFVCGGYQLAGHSYETSDTKLPGMGIFSVYTRRPKENEKRLVGNVSISAEIGNQKLEIVGYENHAGRTYLLPSTAVDTSTPKTPSPSVSSPDTTTLSEQVQSLNQTVPLGKVRSGHGNNGEDKTEGAISDRAIGTYIHGPLLPKNPKLADLLISWGLEHRYGEDVANEFLSMEPKMPEAESKYVRLARKSIKELKVSS